MKLKNGVKGKFTEGFIHWGPVTGAHNLGLDRYERTNAVDDEVRIPVWRSNLKRLIIRSFRALRF